VAQLAVGIVELSHPHPIVESVRELEKTRFDLVGRERAAGKETLQLTAPIGIDCLQLVGSRHPLRSPESPPCRNRTHNVDWTAFSATSFTNERSILILSNGKPCRWLS
jgi:hypothetical protein